MTIKLNFVNRAQLSPAELPTILLFQKQVDDGREYALVWKVIRHCRYQHFRPLSLSTTLTVSMGDEFGNYSRLQPSGPGDKFDATAHGARRRLVLQGGRDDDAGDGIVIENTLLDDTFHACLFARDDLLARSSSLPPGEQVKFALDGTLWVGVARRSADDDFSGPNLPGSARQWCEGNEVSQAVLDSATEIRLAGLAVANIVMYGTPAGFTFKCEGTAPA